MFLILKKHYHHHDHTLWQVCPSSPPWRPQQPPQKSRQQDVHQSNLKISSKKVKVVKLKVKAAYQSNLDNQFQFTESESCEVKKK